MKTKDFILKAKEMGYDVAVFSTSIGIHTELHSDRKKPGTESRLYAAISTVEYGHFEINSANDRLVSLVSEYATTPISEREEEIMRETKFDYLVALEEVYDDLVVERSRNSSIDDILDTEETWKIYALIGNDLELIWDKERDGDEKL